MALTNQQIKELNIAQTRITGGTGTETDVKNVDYAKANLGFAPAVNAPAPPAGIAPSEVKIPTGEAPSQATPEATKQATFINDQGNKVVVDIADKTRQESLKNQGFSLMGSDDKPVTEPLPEKKPLAEQERFTPEGTDQLTGQEAGEGIQSLLESGRVFNETDAQNYAFSINNDNWQQFVGGIGGERNKAYIGPGEWSRLQKTYTPYQIEQATTRTSFGAIQWREGVVIGDIPREDPGETMNKEVDLISNLIGDAKDSADIYTKDSAKGGDFNSSLLGIDTGQSSEDIYTELYNTPEMLNAQKEVGEIKSELDEFDQQLEELRNDIRSEVEGEASDSYITAKATIRGQDILKQRRQKQRDYDTALGNYNNLKENASMLLQFRIHDSETRYNRMFAEIQFLAQRQDVGFDKDLAMTNVALRIPEGKSVTLPNGTVVNGLAEDDNLNVVQFTDADRNTYVIGIDKNTGQQVYKQLLGQSPSPAGGSAYIDRTPYQTLLGETTAQQSLDWMENWNQRMEAGEIGTGRTEDGKSFYFDKKAYETAREEELSGDRWWNPKTYGTQVKIEDYFISYTE